MKAFAENMTRNAEIEATIAKAYRNNMRKSFADQLLASIDDASRKALTKLIKG